ncbi:MAG: zinc ABC transporter substrate-binding protein [Solirubrobacterales bacterium]|nr:zinc ABC transporter substrate-binding protein [Solirubrobacterales bacterium]
MRIRWFRALCAGAVALGVAAAMSGCGGTSAASATGVRIIAAENFWGSIAMQIGGSKASVQSIITNPAQDPHSYEPTAQDARALATAQLAIVNGVGYDPWAPRLLAANPDSQRIVLNVGDQFGLHEGDNPHRWYEPTEVEAVAKDIAGDLSKLDPTNADYYTRQLSTFESSGLAPYHRLIARIARRYAGTSVGASESIFALLAPALRLELATPPSFMKAISEGTEVSAQDTITTQEQMTRHQIKVWIYNPQNATPQIQRLNALARAGHIPIATVTETLFPATASFEQWQVAQLQNLERALHEATGR